MCTRNFVEKRNKGFPKHRRKICLNKRLKNDLKPGFNVTDTTRTLIH